jgi:hypothetical protein
MLMLVTFTMSGKGTGWWFLTLDGQREIAKLRAKGSDTYLGSVKPGTSQPTDREEGVVDEEQDGGNDATSRVAVGEVNHDSEEDHSIPSKSGRASDRIFSEK